VWAGIDNAERGLQHTEMYVTYEWLAIQQTIDAEATSVERDEDAEIVD